MTRSILPIPLLACCFSLLLAADSTAGKYSSGSRSRSYSSGSRSSSSSSSPSSSSSGRSSGSYSSGSTNSSAGSRNSNFSSSQKAATPSSGSGYTTGRSTYSAGSSASRNAVPATNSSGYDASAARAKAMQDSSQRFTDSRRVTTPPPIPDSPAAAPSRTNWRPRERAPMLSAYRSRPAVGFRDGYDLLFWYWLLDQSRPVQAQWIYHHQNQADPARIAELEKKDAALAAEVAALKAQAAPVDPSYTPPGLPPEEMYAQPAAAAEPVTVEEPAMPAQAYPMHSMAGQHEDRRGSSGVSWIVLIAGAGFMTWLLFFKRWNVSSS